MKNYDVICVGSATWDTFLTIHQKLSSVTYGSKVLVKNQETHTGGGGSNSAVALAKLGLKTAYLGKLGPDFNAELIEKELGQFQVKLLNEKKSKLPTDQAFILNSEQEKDRVVYVHKGASDDLKPAELPKKMQAKWFYLATLTGQAFPVLPCLSDYAKKNQIKILFNPSTYLARQGRKKLRPVLKNTDILILNKEEAGLLLGTLNPETHYLLKKLKEEIPGLVVITNGPFPVQAFDGKQIYSASPPKVEVVHSAGCGDAFSSAFLAAFLQKKDIPLALRWGLANAASVLQHLGAKKGLLGKKELLAFLGKYPIKVALHSP